MSKNTGVAPIPSLLSFFPLPNPAAFNKSLRKPLIAQIPSLFHPAEYGEQRNISQSMSGAMPYSCGRIIQNSMSAIDPKFLAQPYQAQVLDMQKIMMDI